jgi:hypothetical protein
VKEEPKKEKPASQMKNHPAKLKDLRQNSSSLSQLEEFFL